MEGRTFPVIEERISPIIKELNDEIIIENLTDEVEQSTIVDEFKMWKEAVKPNSMIALE